MPRPKTVPDDELLAVALALVHRHGPAALTFATLAARIGLAGSTIVQRYGTKAELLQATLLYAWDRLDEATAAADAGASPDPAGVVDLLTALTARYDPDDFADQLVVLREDLRDPALRARGAAWVTYLSNAIQRRLAVAPGGTDGLGELVVAHWQGTLTVWGFTRRAPLPDEVRRTLTVLLERLLDGRDRRTR